MTETRLRRLGAGIAVASLLAVGLALALLVSNRSTWTATNVLDLFNNHVAIYALALTYTLLGGLVLRRQPGNRVAWVMLGCGSMTSLTLLFSEYAVHTLVVARGSLPGGVLFATIQSVGFFPIVFPYGLGLLLLLFPNGRLPSRRLRPVLWLVSSDAIFVFGATLLMGGALRSNFRNVDLHVQNPVGIVPEAVYGALPDVTWGLLLGWLFLCAATLVVRMVRARGTERQQLKWVVYAGVVMGAGFVTGSLPLPIPGTDAHGNNPLFVLGVLGAAVALPGAMGIGILRYRLFDIDLVISRTVLFALMAIFIATVYVAIVAGVGYALGSGGRPNLVLSIVATVVVALAFQPVRDQAEKLANRLAYGRQSTPYEVLSHFNDQVAVYGRKDMLAYIARAVSEGVGAAEASVWVRQDGRLVDRADWPVHQNGARPAPDRLVEVTHLGKSVGAIAVAKPGAEPLTPVEEGLLQDLAAQAGPVIHNVTLNDELSRRLEELSQRELELRLSRQRIVAAQDAERRRLERNIHDGAQQHLVALAVKLGLAKTFATRDADRAAKLLEELESEVADAQATLAALSRGIYPPLLSEQGLEVALRQEARTLEIDCRFVVRDLQRHEIDLEGAVYFCCLEALQNAAKHARGSEVEVSLEEGGGELQFSVRDHGPGFDRDKTGSGSGLKNMRQRIEALGGYVEVFSRPGQGVWIVGRLPVGAGT